MYINFHPDISSLPSPPLNLTAVVSVTNSSVTINWVAPLDTPLCVHSYTVTVRNVSSDQSTITVNRTNVIVWNIYSWYNQEKHTQWRSPHHAAMMVYCNLLSVSFFYKCSIVIVQNLFFTHMPYQSI